MNRINTIANWLLAFGLLNFVTGCSDGESSKAASTVANSNDSPTLSDTSDPPTERPVPNLTPLPTPAGTNGFSIAQVMQLAHKNNLYRELYHVPVDSAVAERLLTLYKNLPDQVPPKGEDDDWQIRAKALVDAAEAIISGDATQIPALKKAINCNSCHNRHRP